MSFSIVLFDDFEERANLLPLVATRPIGNLRVGALTIDQKWKNLSNQDVSYLTVDYLQHKFPCNPLQSVVILVNASLLPTRELLNVLIELEFNNNLVDENGNWLGTKLMKEDLSLFQHNKQLYSFEVYFTKEISQIIFPEDIFQFNSTQIEFDISISVEYQNQIKKSGIYIADSAQVAENVTLDSSKGSILILDNVVIESQCVIQGPAVIGEHSRIKAGTVIYQNVTIGPHCTICGELNNTVIWGNSAKGHYGYLGCAVIGEGCNLGAGTSNSNLKNDWNAVKLYNYRDKEFRNTGLLKCGVFIGDHSMLGISSKINTGTVIGVGAQIAMSNFIPKFVPDYSWLSDAKHDRYDFTKFTEMMRRKAEVKNEQFTAIDVEILKYLHHKTLKNN